MRVCLDTNVLIAAFATRGLCSDVVRVVLTEHELVLGEVILQEFRRVLKNKLKVPAERLAAAEAVFAAVEVIPKPAQPSELSIADTADPWVVATAISGRADALVTGNRELLAAEDEASLPIISPRAFWEQLRSVDIDEE